MKKNWVLKNIDTEKTNYISKHTGLSINASKILNKRGLTDLNEIKSFLKPVSKLEMVSWDKETSQAIGLFLKEKIKNQDLITVHGDYDVDGVTGASILAIFFRDKKANFNCYLPDRFGDGYGLAMATVEKLHKNGTKVIITADCGISNYKEIEYANSLGMEVIVTDHHTLPEELPPAKFIFHPALSNDPKFHILSGVGTAFQLIYNINHLFDSLHNIKIDDYVDLVAIGTIADISPLKGINRDLVKYGLIKLKNTKKIGLLKLMEGINLNRETISAQDIAFKIVPRLNATGRMNHAKISLDLLLSEKEDEAKLIVDNINEINKNRQLLCDETFFTVEEIIKKEVDLVNDKAIFVASEGLHHGVIGIICSRILEKYNKPVFISSIEGDIVKGSGRSKNMHLVDALKSSSEHLIKFGGHAGASGWSLAKENITKFKESILHYAQQNISENDLVSVVDIDAEINLDEIDYQLYRELQEFEPYGLSNPELVICAKNVIVEKNSQRTSRDGKHLFFNVIQNDKKMKAVFWRGGDFYPLADTIDLTYTIFESDDKGTKELKIRVNEIINHKNYSAKNIKFNSIKEKTRTIEFDFYELLNIANFGYLNTSYDVNKVDFQEKITNVNHDNIKIIDLRNTILNENNVLNLIKKNENEFFNLFSFNKLAFLQKNNTLDSNYSDKETSLIFYDLPDKKETFRDFLDMIVPSKIYLFYIEPEKNLLNAKFISSFIKTLYANNDDINNFIISCNEIDVFKNTHFKPLFEILIEAQVIVKKDDKYTINLDKSLINLNNLDTYHNYLTTLKKRNEFIDFLNKITINQYKEYLLF